MSARNNRFANAEDGAVTVDWVVLCAALVAFVIFATTLIGARIVTSTNGSAETMQNMPAYEQ